MKPCPFCGTKDPNYHNGWGYKDQKKKEHKFRSPSITCEGCGIGFTTGSFGWGISDEDAEKITIEAWNLRDNDNRRTSLKLCPFGEEAAEQCTPSRRDDCFSSKLCVKVFPNE